MAIDLVVTDLDGSFWDHDENVHPTTHDALAELRARNIALLIATGRRMPTARAGLAKVGLAPPAILLNGGLGVDLATGEQFHRCTYDADLAMHVLGVFARAGHVPCAYSTDGTIHVAPGVTTGPVHRASFGDDAIETNPIRTAREGNVVGFSIIGVDEESIAPIGPELVELGCNVVHYQDSLFGGWSIMTQAPGVSKWTGVVAYAERIGLDNPNVLCVGDGGNDVELLTEATVGLGVRGGHDVALAAASATIDPPEEGGWASVLDHLD